MASRRSNYRVDRQEYNSQRVGIAFDVSLTTSESSLTYDPCNEDAAEFAKFARQRSTHAHARAYRFIRAHIFPALRQMVLLYAEARARLLKFRSIEREPIGREVSLSAVLSCVIESNIFLTLAIVEGPNLGNLLPHGRRAFCISLRAPIWIGSYYIYP